MAVNSEEDADAIIENEILFKEIIDYLAAQNRSVRKEAFYVVTNLLTTASVYKLASVLNDYPGILSRLVSGLNDECMLKDELSIQHMLNTII